MKSKIAAVFRPGTFIVFLVLAGVVSAQAPENDVRTKTEQWFDLWSPGSDPIDWEAFRPLYMAGEEAILVIDDFGDEVTTITSVDEYIATWKPVMAEEFRSWSIQPEGLIDYRVGSTLAVATFILVADGETFGDIRVTPRQYGTLIFVKDDIGDWRIVQERLTTLSEPSVDSSDESTRQ